MAAAPVTSVHPDPTRAQGCPWVVPLLRFHKEVIKGRGVEAGPQRNETTGVRRAHVRELAKHLHNQGGSHHPGAKCSFEETPPTANEGGNDRKVCARANLSVHGGTGAGASDRQRHFTRLGGVEGTA
jgi:hypothetical protein